MLFAFKNLKIPIENFKMLKDKCQKYNNVIFTGSLSTMCVGSFYDLLLDQTKEKTSSSGRTDCYWSGRRTSRFAGSNSAGSRSTGRV